MSEYKEENNLIINTDGIDSFCLSSARELSITRDVGERQKENGSEAEKPTSNPDVTPLIDASTDLDKESDEAQKKQAKKSKDALLYEAAYTLADQIDLLKTHPDTVSRTLGKPSRAGKAH